MSRGSGADILPTHTPALFDAAVSRVVEALVAGEVVALPTETVYGLAANAFDARAVARLFEIKGRPAHNPVIVHVADLGMARRCVAAWPDTAERLAAAFWPGPLTLVLPRSHLVPDLVTAGGPTVGVRWPSHPFIQAVILRAGFPLAAPSANPSNLVSPTTASHVHESLGSRLRLIVDGGQCQVGIESSVIDLTSSPPRLLRPGMIHAESLTAVVGPVASIDNATAGPALRSPGLLDKHYSPKARLLVLRWTDDHDLRQQVEHRALPPACCHIMAHAQIPSGLSWGGVSVMPHDAEAYARALYAELHRSDAAGAGWILIEALPEGPEWDGIADRLRRAAGGGGREAGDGRPGAGDGRREAGGGH